MTLSDFQKSRDEGSSKASRKKVIEKSFDAIVDRANRFVYYSAGEGMYLE